MTFVEIRDVSYYPHNFHFLWFAATFDGQAQLAIDSARKVAGKIGDQILKKMPITQAFRVVPYWALTRFGRWDDMLREPALPAGSAFLRGAWHYARGLALVAKGQLSNAAQELAKLRVVMKDKSLQQSLFSPNTGAAVLSVAPEMLAGEIAAARKRYDVAIAHMEKAVRLEDALVYTEPSEWHYPPRHALGAVLLASGRAAEAETVYWEDLRRNRDNGWALFGLLQSLRAQSKTDEATLIEARFQNAWQRADVTLAGSRFGGTGAATVVSSAALGR